jgi:hypothetical protein
MFWNNITENTAIESVCWLQVIRFFPPPGRNKQIELKLAYVSSLNLAYVRLCLPWKNAERDILEYIPPFSKARRSRFSRANCIMPQAREIQFEKSAFNSGIGGKNSVIIFLNELMSIYKPKSPMILL